MKKVLFCLLFVVGTTISVQAQVVYSCDFETASSRSGWRDGDHYMSYNTLTIGTAINHGGNYSLYTRPSANSSAFGYTAYTSFLQNLYSTLGFMFYRLIAMPKGILNILVRKGVIL